MFKPIKSEMMITSFNNNSSTRCTNPDLMRLAAVQLNKGSSTVVNDGNGTKLAEYCRFEYDNNAKKLQKKTKKKKTTIEENYSLKYRHRR